MVIINGITAILVPKPIIMRIEQITSEKTAKVNERVELSPKSAGNAIGSPDNSIPNFGMPCTNINNPIANLAINKTPSILIGFMSNIFFIFKRKLLPGNHFLSFFH